MYKYQFNSMSTIVHISISRELFGNEMMPVYKLFDGVENTCSRFREDSELSRLNQLVGKEVFVSEDMFSILTMAERFYKETKGIFNPGILTALEVNGYSKSIEAIRGTKLELVSPSVTVAVPPYTLNKRLQSVTLHTKIDLGGIAKGWVIDRAAQYLEKLGYGFINVGGDIRIFGHLPRPLNIGIENPFAESKIISSIQVKTGALATSTSRKRKWQMMNGEWAHHLIDTRTGKSSNSEIVSATVTASTAVQADVWAKTSLLLGEEKGLNWLLRKGGLAVLINKDRKIWRGGSHDGVV